jgi:hypothetical protein
MEQHHPEVFDHGIYLGLFTALAFAVHKAPQKQGETLFLNQVYETPLRIPNLGCHQVEGHHQRLL